MLFSSSPGTKSTVAVTGYLEQYIAASDLAAFFAAYDPTHARTATIIGPNDQTNPGTEASLDIQYSMGVAPGIPGTFWYDHSIHTLFSLGIRAHPSSSEAALRQRE